jgi:hypothetical protein
MGVLLEVLVVVLIRVFQEENDQPVDIFRKIVAY